MASQIVYRYTELPSLIHLLTRRELTLLDPLSWDDKNDSSFITFYREKCNLKSVLALCFARSEETYHHWRVFAPGASGVRIQFDEDRLRNSIDNVPELKFQDVEYLTVDSLKGQRIDKERLPFLKRHPFYPEREARLLWESKNKNQSSLGVPITLSAISRITLSPWLHPSLVPEVRSLIKRIDGCSKIKIYQSTLISNAKWLKHGESAT
ncbi:hypothetical protein C8R32_104216 [Nitrosospira sp. Nsp5]|uniref:DUF2971 domain-containing protein n=1 Tax=Nitrosospira multiformis TaxID=1231 RepID=A0ABY0TEQ2_9PROT|nr:MULTISPECIES: hypothetical protein [Nitrosospira]PTR09137.1 hypothetical protein C8R32_104216 [Nitrosospira sp. Nsp5]SDQ71745.1 hypothetical protein SAMN05216402_1995 [Nitrosospira multiformis]